MPPMKEIGSLEETVKALDSSASHDEIYHRADSKVRSKNSLAKEKIWNEVSWCFSIQIF